MGIDSGISKSEVSRICAGLDETVGAFRTWGLDHVEFPYVYLDATYLHVRSLTSQVTSMAVVVATGATATGQRGILGLDVGDSEDEVFWKGFMTSLKAARPGRSETGHQRPARGPGRGAAALLPGRRAPAVCRVHFTRNLLARVPKAQADYVAAAFRTIFAQTKPADVHTAWDKTRDEFAARFPELGPLMDDAKAEVLAFTGFPRANWRRIWSTNRSSGSTRRSSAAAASWAGSRTTRPSSGSSAPCCAICTTSGSPATPLLSEGSMAKLYDLKLQWRQRRHRQRRVGTEDHLEAHHTAGLCRWNLSARRPPMRPSDERKAMWFGR